MGTYITHTQHCRPQLCHTSHKTCLRTALSHTTLSRAALSHTQIFRTQPCQQASFTPNSLAQNIVAHKFVTAHLSYPTLAHRTLSHTTCSHVALSHATDKSFTESKSFIHHEVYLSCLSHLSFTSVWFILEVGVCSVSSSSSSYFNAKRSCIFCFTSTPSHLYFVDSTEVWLFLFFLELRNATSS